MNEVTIYRNPLGDSRTATKIPTFTEFQRANNLHRKDVYAMMSEIGNEFYIAGSKHDLTKFSEPEASLFYRELCNTIEGNMDFEQGEWYRMHVTTERHHLDKYVPDNVNLIDVLEMVCDCICAGMARSGEVRPFEVSDALLRKAFDNTVKMCIDSVVLSDD